MFLIVGMFVQRLVEIRADRKRAKQQHRHEARGSDNPAQRAGHLLQGALQNHG